MKPEDAVEGLLAADTVMETPALRIVRLALAPGAALPWHWHSRIIDHIVCLEGAVEVEMRAPRARFRLGPGQECAVPAKTAHTVRNPGRTVARYLAIQGVGAYDRRPVGGGS
jgi:mannose-6-phosphate isomerase-like protein (cupin superfamily)